MEVKRLQARRRRPADAGVVGLVIALVMALSFIQPLAAPAAADAALPDTLEFVPTTADSVPFLSHAAELADVGWVEEEYFVGGVGNVYEYDAAGDVQVQTADVPYKTRLLIRRPAKTQHSNGLVVVEWLNPTAGFDVEAHWTYQSPYFIREGITYVGVTQKTVTVDFLAAWDPDRYGSLTMPEEGQIWDIMNQISSLLRSDDAANPLRNVPVDVLIHIGYSQSAGYLITYANEFHQSTNDAYFIAANFTSAHKINSGDPNYTDDRRLVDVDVPAIRYQSETEYDSPSWPTITQPDSPTFRQWEVAGAAHAPAGAVPFDICTGPAINSPRFGPVKAMFVLNAAVEALDTWARNGEPAPTAPRVERNPDGTVARDTYGNAIGGIRMPQLEAPLGTYLGHNTGPGFCFLFGTFIAFDDTTVDTLYPNHGTYVSRVVQATQNLVRDRFILIEDAQALRSEAIHSDVGIR
jgi:hypothetical protein